MTTRTPFVLLAALSSFVLSGCPGRLSNPELFIGGSSEGGVRGCTISPANIESQLIRPRCATSGCHDTGGRSGGLDLQSPNVGMRLIGVMSPNCSGRRLVDMQGMPAGLFLDKLGENPSCGMRMPAGSPAFTESEMACVRTWLSALSPTPPPDVIVVDTMPPMDVQNDVRPDIVMTDTPPAETTPMDAPADSNPMDAGPMDAMPVDSNPPDENMMMDVQRDVQPPRDTPAPDVQPSDVQPPPDVQSPPDMGMPPEDTAPPTDAAAE